jgi:hypothetical protein
MKWQVRGRGRAVAEPLLVGLLVALIVPSLGAQMGPNERAFPQSKATIEKALRAIPTSVAGHLPALEGFAQTGEHALDRYNRGYYQATVEVTATPSGGSLVRVSMKVTAWYNDPVASHSGYQLLASNGRLEVDLLDQLADQLTKTATPETATVASTSASKPLPAATSTSTASPPASNPPASQPPVSTAAPKFPDNRTFSSSLSQSLAAQERANGGSPQPVTTDKSTSALQAEAESLQEILKNQGHPKNLVAVKKSGTPVVGSPSLNSKPLFLASMHDEFEMLDFNADWVHVRVSGLSRGWIWRNSLEMPDGIADTDAHPASSVVPAADLFHVSREETSPFPGDWEPLRSKTVKIISVQKIDDSAKDPGPKERLEYAKYLLEKSYKEMAEKPQGSAGIVVIFDAVDGGMIAATMPTLQQWRAGTLSDSALWHKCFFDPPETFESTGSAASQ